MTDPVTRDTAQGKNRGTAKTPRRQFNFTMNEELYQACKKRCEKLDVPVTVWVRHLIKRELANPTFEI